jgi:hypothetical protein
MNSKALFAGALAASLLAWGSVAFASPVTGTLGITYFDVLNGTGGPDFGGAGTPNVAAGSALGPNGQPVVNSVTPGVTEFNPATHELTWWNPLLNSAVHATGSGVVTIPYSSDMFPLNSLGTSDAAAFETAVLKGTFNLATAGTVHFTVGSDDDAFVYVNGILVGQNPGIHGLSDVTFAATGLAGVNTLEIFYADRERVAAHLDVSADVTLTAGVPEPSTWAMMILGFAGIGFMGYRRGKSQGALRVA